MEEYARIAVLENEVEARVLDDLLTERGIPHAIQSYRDLAYDGLFQMQKGWGHVEALVSRRDEVLEILDDLRRGESEGE
ncbi:hypothetical protein JW916_10300 [Candidatus Sumerlaeota bacterium]|nr:hypothetical protein [Candidatus Sumerlaeota bacterium]